MNLRIATYNLFEGGGSSYNRLIEFVHQANLDVLCLQEVNHWEDADMARLKDFTDKTLFSSYAFGNSNTEYKLATVAKHPITNKVLHAEAFWHAALETRIKVEGKEIVVFNLHLDPWQESSREKEINRVLAAVDPHVPTIITGDFNSLSPQDDYGSNLLPLLMAKGISKYGTQAIEHRVVDRLLSMGFVDAAVQVNEFIPTVPTAFSTDKDHEVPVRIDYIFVSPDLAQLIKSVECVKTDLTETISDHYPVILTLSSDVVAPEEKKLPPVPGAPQPAPVEPMPYREIPEPWTPPAESAPPTQEKKKQGPEIDEDGDVVMWTHDKQ